MRDRRVLNSERIVVAPADGGLLNGEFINSPSELLTQENEFGHRIGLRHHICPFLVGLTSFFYEPGNGFWGSRLLC